MPDNVYVPSGELVNRRADTVGREQDALIEVGVRRQAGMPYDAEDLPEEVNGMKVERPEKVEPSIKGFFRSQIADPKFYTEHKAEILEATRHNLIVDDKTDRKYAEQQKLQHEEAAGAMRKGDERILLPLQTRDAKKVADEAWKAFEDAEREHTAWVGQHGVMGDPRVNMAAWAVVQERRADYNEANAKFNDLTKKLNDMRLGRKPVEG